MAKNMVETQEYGAPQKQILIADELAFTIGAKILDVGTSAKNGKKIVKAGTALGGNLLKRDAGFDVALFSGDDMSQDTSNAVAVLLHDVDVTDGPANGTIVIGGYIDILKLDEDVQTQLKSHADALKHIVLLEGSKV